MSALDPDSDNSVVEQALRDGQLHKALLDHLEAGIYMVDRTRRILYWNRGAEQISGFLSQDVAGHFCQGDLLMHCDSSGRGMCGKGCPLSAVMLDGKPREHDFFLRHRQGHRVPVHVRSRPISDPAGAIIGAVEVFEPLTVPAPIDRRALNEHGCLDPLAEVANRVYAEFRLGQALEALLAFGISFGWMAVKLDDVENLEHRYGHGLVDAAVKMTARMVDFNLGPQDTAARWDRTELRIEVHSCWGVGLGDLTAKLRALTLASDVDWWGDRVRVPVSIAGVMAEPGDSTKSLEARISQMWPRATASGGDSEQDFLKLGDESCLE